MSTAPRGHVEHDSLCQTPLNEHTGTEPCLVYVTDDDAEVSVPIAHYAQGPQGNQIADYYADYVASYGTADRQRQLGSPDIEDRRDARDPSEVGAAVLAVSNGSAAHG